MAQVAARLLAKNPWINLYYIVNFMAANNLSQVSVATV